MTQPNDASARIHVGIDTGGTFTDFTVLCDGQLRVFKRLSTPDNPARAIIEGLNLLGLDPSRAHLAHGSTVATNALLEGKGVRTAYIANEGLTDVLTIGRQNRRELFCLSPRPVEPPVPESLCLGLSARRAADGQLLWPLEESELAALAETLRAMEVEAAAVNLLFSYLDDREERQIAAYLGDQLHVSLSSGTLGEAGEYERGIATWINASIGPVVRRYLGTLSETGPYASLRIMQSNGLSTHAADAADQAVRLLLSGPAGGLVGAQAACRAMGFDAVMTLDVGGTSSDVALIQGEISVTRDNRIGDWPVAIPAVDMHTIGAGGGSIIRLDARGMLHVGPESAGADPGPACYDRGGRVPTVTDAHLLLGHLDPDTRLADDLILNTDLARDALRPLAQACALEVEQLAEGAIRLANEQMAAALRVISVERGIDPRTLALCCFGGAGGLHGCQIADLLGTECVLIPDHAGVLSSVGLILGEEGREVTRSIMAPLGEQDGAAIDRLIDTMTEQLVESGDHTASAGLEWDRRCWLECRYQGQSLLMPIEYTPGGHPLTNIRTRFESAYQSRFGSLLEFPVELASVRIRLSRAAAVTLPDRPGEALTNTTRAGPAAISTVTGSLWIEAGWQAEQRSQGWVLTRQKPQG